MWKVALVVLLLLLAGWYRVNNPLFDAAEQKAYDAYMVQLGKDLDKCYRENQEVADDGSNKSLQTCLDGHKLQ